MNTVLEKASSQQSLRVAGLRVTPARVAVYSLLSEAQAPLSHADVVKALATSGFNRATLYRNLLELSQAGLVLREHFGDKVWRFSVLPHGQHQHEGEGLLPWGESTCCGPVNPHQQHPHFVCETCGSVHCYALAVDLKQLVTEEDLPFIREVSLKGVCAHCRASLSYIHHKGHKKEG